MDIRLEVAVVAAGASAIVAWLTASLTLRNELTKLQLAAQSTVFTRLLEARIVPYASLYAELSSIIKELETNRVEWTTLEERLGRIELWDSANSMLLGPRTTNICWEFRQKLRSAIEVLRAVSPKDNRRALVDLFEGASELELALRTDLGIYGLTGVASQAQIKTPVVASYFAGEGK